MKQGKRGKDGPETRFRQKDIEDFGSEHCSGVCRVRKEGDRDAAHRRRNNDNAYSWVGDCARKPEFKINEKTYKGEGRQHGISDLTAVRVPSIAEARPPIFKLEAELVAC